MAANRGVDPWLPGVGTDVVIPDMHVLPDAPRRGIVINLTEMRLYLFSPKGDVVGTWPIGIGQQGDMTPLGATSIVRKQLDPTWFVPKSIREEKPELPASVPPGPDNPLGDRALFLGWPGFLIHGTNKPYGVGRRVSHGCIRLYPEGIAELYRLTPVGTPVTVVDQAAVLGWRAGELYLQVHPTKAQADQIEAGEPLTLEPIGDLHDKVVAAAGDRADAIDWRAVDRAAVERTGIPVVVVSREAAREVSGDDMTGPVGGAGDTVDQRGPGGADDTGAAGAPERPATGAPPGTEGQGGGATQPGILSPIH
jgi:L,D-transpeptidase ErfK/SrfK